MCKFHYFSDHLCADAGTPVLPTQQKYYRTMSGVLLDPQLAAALGRLYSVLGQQPCIPAVMDVLDAVCPTDSCGVLVFYREQKPLSLLHRFHPVQRQVDADIYSTGPYALDPQYRLFLQGCPSDAYWLRDIAPDDFYASPYYQSFYSKTGVADSIDVLWRIDADTALVFFMQRNINSNEFSPQDLQALRLVLPMVGAALDRHYQLAAQLPGTVQTHQHTDQAADQTHLQVQCTLNNFASSLLTKRERDVLLYLLRGYSSALTAEKLHTSDGTVKIHRKNIYRKLEIGSQAELFSLFISCIPFAQTDVASDPLMFYQQSRQNSQTS